MDKDLRKILQALEAQGFEVKTTKRGRYQVIRDGRVVTVFGGSTGDWRAIRNALAPLKRAGFRWPPRP
jgi:2'-5' RNA ligase